MSRFGVDFAWGSASSDALRRDGVTFVARYISTPGNSKNISASEARRLSEGGIDIVLVFETTAGRAGSGYSAGASDARSAAAQATSVGAPAGVPIYFAVDFDTSGATVAAYFKGVASVLGVERTGAYGSYRVIKYLFDNKLIAFGWQTYAWSGGAWDSRAQLNQYSNDHTLAGVSCDFDRATADDFGQWRVGQPRESAARRELKRKIAVWTKELEEIRAYIRKKGDGWARHPKRWARAKRLKGAIARTEKKLKETP